METASAPIRAIPMEFFDRQWSSYRAIVEHDLMEHAALAAATAAAIDTWLAARGHGATAPALVDLGCGDLALLAPLLRRLPLAQYTGLDLAPVVLPLAERALGPVPYPTSWQEGDLLAWAEQSEGPSTDLLHSSFAVHHLDDEQKRRFLSGARRRIRPGGLFLWGDVFRMPQESLAAYLERYILRIRSWTGLSPEQQEHVIQHLSRFDKPADRHEIVAVAQGCGWNWRWIWQGQHGAEALALLSPVP